MQCEIFCDNRSYEDSYQKGMQEMSNLAREHDTKVTSKDSDV